MGRPRNDSQELSAAEKIENAFWKVLEEEGFQNITIRRLTQESGVNKNSIYYHYKTVEEIAKKAFEHNSDYQLVSSFITMLISDNSEVSFDQNILFHLKRLHLLAGSKSSFLQSLVTSSIISIWITISHIDTKNLSATDHIVLNFIVTGVTSILDSDTIIENPTALLAFPLTPVGKAAIQSLQNMPVQI